MNRAFTVRYIDESLKKIRSDKGRRKEHIDNLRNHIFHAGRALKNHPDFSSCASSVLDELEELFSNISSSDNKKDGKYLKKAGSAILKSLEPLKIFMFLTCPGGGHSAEGRASRLKDISLHMFYPLKEKGQFKEEIKEVKRKADIMAFLPFFSPLSTEEIERISSRVKMRRYEEGAVLFNEGEMGDEVYIIKSGEVKIYKERNGVREDFVSLSKGDMFGEMALISEKPRGFSACISSKKSEIYVTGKEDFFFMLRKYSSLAFNFAKILCERIAITNKRLLGRLEDYYFYMKDRGKLEKARKKSEIMGALSFFDDLSLKEIEKIASKFKYRRYEGGTVIFHMGDCSHYLYILKSGEITVYKPSHIETEKRDFAGLKKGDIFGEMGVISGMARSLSARVTSDNAEVYRMVKEDFLDMVCKYPQLGINLSRVFCNRIDEANRRLLSGMR